MRALPIPTDVADAAAVEAAADRVEKELGPIDVWVNVAFSTVFSPVEKLTPDEVQGGTFTITNPGGYGTFHGTPVISQPQAGILGTYALVKRPWVIQDSFGKDVIAIRPIMNITLTYDHRLVDGADAARFLVAVKQRLEEAGFEAELGM